VKILDFGVAKLTADIGPAQKTRTGAVIGSPAYMAPEQCRGSAQVDARADIYSIGCIMFEMACGDIPFNGEGAGEVIAKHIYELPPRPRTLVPALSADLERVILRCMAKLPSERFASAAELARALERWPAPPPAARQSGVDTLRFSRQSVSSTTLGGSAAETRAPGRGRRRALVAIAVAVLAALGGAAVIATRVGPRTQAPPIVSPIAAPVAAQAPDARPPPPSPDAAPAPTRPGRMIRLEIVTTPDGASVYRSVDGVLLGTTPFAREIERTDGQAEFILKKAGYRDQRVALPADQDGMTGIRLTPEPHRRPAKKDPP
jgi:serine/threonine-protein kinase